MLRLVKRFNRENPGIRVIVQRIEWGTCYNKLLVEGLSNRAPEVFVIHASNLERFRQAQFIRSINDLMLGPDGLDARDMAPSVWRATEKQGIHCGLPLDVFTLGMYYNRKLLREAGVVDANGEAAPPKSRDEFMCALRKIAAMPHSGGAPRGWGVIFTNLRSNIYAVVCQFGGKFLSEDSLC